MPSRLTWYSLKQRIVMAVHQTISRLSYTIAIGVKEKANSTTTAQGKKAVEVCFSITNPVIHNIILIVIIFLSKLVFFLTDVYLLY